MTNEDLTNRFMYHKPPNNSVANKYEDVRFKLFAVVKEILELTPESRESALFVTKMEEAMFWANAAIARNS